ncbi:DnaJ-like protein xdj1 [Sporothrix curviconia]|uniref:DnaJ-like protein xdj1 n=1 Tax=Sporothrix curviconia TaxID=1260050 RepID=A0ABP0BR35_9PEZI
MDSDGSNKPSVEEEEVDLYELLGVEKTATPGEIKKAYRKAALQHHPDKVPEEQRAESEVKFKAVTQAYEILRDDEKRQLYDQFGMAAFDPSRGGPGDAGVDLNDMLAQMFGMNVGGSGAGGHRRPRRGQDEEQQYKVTLEELYKGKTVKFAANKRVICSQCKGSGAKDKVKPQQCDRCKGAGVREAYRQVGPGLIRQEVLPCDNCDGTDDLSAEISVTLAETLTGFSRVVLKHLDGRGIHLDHPRGKILQPMEILKVTGEGMPRKRGDDRGDLYLSVKVEFPEAGWLHDDGAYETIRKLLPPPPPLVEAEEVDEVEYEADADIEQSWDGLGE